LQDAKSGGLNPIFNRAQGHALQPVPVMSLHLLSIAFCGARAIVYDAVGCALTFHCPLCAAFPLIYACKLQ
jgi:hypothetical protein